MCSVLAAHPQMIMKTTISKRAARTLHLLLPMFTYYSLPRAMCSWAYSLQTERRGVSHVTHPFFLLWVQYLFGPFESKVDMAADVVLADKMVETSMLQLLVYLVAHT